MVVIEKINEHLVRQYSNSGLKLKQIETGIIYEDAIDIIPCKYTYEEITEEEEE